MAKSKEDFAELLGSLKEANKKGNTKEDDPGCLYLIILFLCAIPVGLLNVAMMAYSSLLVWKMHVTEYVGSTPSFFFFVGLFYLASIIRLPITLGVKDNGFKVDRFHKLIGLTIAFALLCGLSVFGSWLFTLFV